MTERVLRAATAVLAAGLLALSACNKAPPAAPAAPATPPAPAAADTADVKAFLDGIYAHYAKPAGESTWNEFDDKVIPTIFDADTAALMRRMMSIPSDGPGESNDGDWFCSCQDWEPFTAKITVKAATPTTAQAVVQVKPDERVRTVTIDLVKEAAGWRVHDLLPADPDNPNPESFRAALQKDIKDFTAAAPAMKGADAK